MRNPRWNPATRGLIAGEPGFGEMLEARALAKRQRDGYNYRGWEVTYDRYRPATGLWRAERFGVGMGSGEERALIRMIDVRVTEEQEAARKREIDKEGG